MHENTNASTNSIIVELCMHYAKDSTGYLLMRRTQKDWSREDALLLKALVEVIGPIVEIRNHEEEAKKEATENLQRFEAIFLGSPDISTLPIMQTE